MNNDAPQELEPEIPEAWNKHRPVPTTLVTEKRPDDWNLWHVMAGLAFLIAVFVWVNSGTAFFGGGLVICLLLVIVGELNEIKRRP